MDIRSKTVTKAEAEKCMLEAPAAERASVIHALFEFGSMHLGTIRDSSAVLDQKATAYLGWAGATAAFLMVGTTSDWFKTSQTQVTVLAWAAIAASLVAAFAAFDALRVRDWQWPSEADWFCQPEFSEALRLRAHHVISLLITAKHHSTLNAQKGRRLVVAEYAQILATTLVAAIAVWKLIP